MKPEEIFADMLVPVICAPMFTVSGPELVTACGKAGIMGVLPAGTARTAEEFSGWVDQVSADLAAHSDKTGKPAGPWAANLSAGSALRNGEERAKAEIAACQKHRPKLVITVGGDPTDLVKIVHDWGGLVFHDVTTLKHTEKAIAAGVDGLILIGGGGGGHAGILNPFPFVRAVRKFWDKTIVLAGAMSDGASVRAAQYLGADLVYMGTRFIATQESRAPQAYKQMIVDSGITDVLYTPTFTHGVPACFMTASMRAHGFDPKNLPPAPKRGETPLTVKAWKDVWAAGQGVALIDDIPTVADLVARLHKEYLAAAKPRGYGRG